jgi:hypothetical protein
MRKPLLILLIAAGVTMAGIVIPAGPAGADKLYHTDQIALVPVDGAPLKAGHVVNIHPNGPQIFARERYVLIGAEPSSTYQVNLLVYPFEPECDGDAVVIPTAELETNAVGNGTAQVVLRPTDVGEPLHNNTHGVAWEVLLEGETVYKAAFCSAVALD